MSVRDDVLQIARQAKQAARFLAAAGAVRKNQALEAMAEAVQSQEAAILAANEQDVAAARRAGKNTAFLDRLALTPERIAAMGHGLRAVAQLPDPVGEVVRMGPRPNGLIIGKMRVPLGVIGIIYESRPDVTGDCAGLCLKSGNAVILRGGSEALRSNQAIFQALNAALARSGFPPGCIALVPTAEREAVGVLLSLNDYIDLIIPRGGEALIRTVTEESKIPVIKHYKGICHTYVDDAADLAMAEEIAFNAKVQRPATCNAMECLLVHAAVAEAFLPRAIARLRNAGVEIRGCARTQAIVPGVQAAGEQDYATEYLDLILSVRVVRDMDEACAHIERFGTRHSEAIVTENLARGMRFLKEVDAACVYVNASTRFTDGNQFGLGAEMGISTDKLHARGPMGLEELTTYKYIILGNGQVRA
ncbi:MAG: glutamate-5-semialdehyde dehydrogenase [Candidatus Omnitrophica bacterium]|nr:glutamate-5-semialdehyde dehydrogenase [Candidatus Omnitrophota bacterium]